LVRRDEGVAAPGRPSISCDPSPAARGRPEIFREPSATARDTPLRFRDPRSAARGNPLSFRDPRPRTRGKKPPFRDRRPAKSQDRHINGAHSLHDPALVPARHPTRQAPSRKPIAPPLPSHYTTFMPPPTPRRHDGGQSSRRLVGELGDNRRFSLRHLSPTSC